MALKHWNFSTQSKAPLEQGKSIGLNIWGNVFNGIARLLSRSNIGEYQETLQTLGIHEQSGPDNRVVETILVKDYVLLKALFADAFGV